MSEHTVTDTSLALTADPQVTSLDTITDKPKRKAPSTAFRPGPDARRNTAGRPRKGESFAEKYVKAVTKDADAIIAAHVKRAKGDGVVASKDGALAMAYAMGRPVQPYVHVGGEDPYLDLMQEIAAAGGMRMPPPGEASDDAT